MELEDGGKLAFVNKSQRQKLMAALREMDGEETRALFLWGAGREPAGNRQDAGVLCVHVVCRNPYGVTDWDYWTLIDWLWQGQELFSKHYQRLSGMQEFLQVTSDNGYDPATAYIVPRKKTGRPRRELTEEERGKIESMREAGASINAIASTLHISNRIVMDYVGLSRIVSEGLEIPNRINL